MAEKTCERFADLLAERAGLSDADRRMLDAHLEGCDACRALAATLAPIDAPVRLELPVVPVASYQFGREVARGGMGRVVAAQDLRIGRPVAVKELLGSAPALAARFEREARITARLQHPNIVPIYEIGAWPDGTPFYAMRLVEGRTLSAALADEGNRLALLPSVIAAAEAVAFAHAHGVIHRDLKPSNIMVGAFGETVVIDWGLAKTLDEDDDHDDDPYRTAPASDLTAYGEVMGTAAYMPPEQANGDAVDRRADVYALGAILYHLLTGGAPYKGASSLDIVEQVRREPPAPLPASAPRDLASIVGKAMARDPDDRYADAGELAKELERFQSGQVVAAHVYSRRERFRRWLRRHRVAVIGGVAALVALLVAGGIGLAGVMRERDVADAERDRANANAKREHDVAVALLEEQGRQELIAGHIPQAMAYLDAAMQEGLDTSDLRFMLARSLETLRPPLQSFDCPGEPGFVFPLVEGDRLAAACGDNLRIWDLGRGRELATIPNLAPSQFSLQARWLVAGGDHVALVDHDGHVAKQYPDAIKGHLSSDEKTLTLLGKNGELSVVELASDRVVRHFGHTPRPRYGRFSRFGKLVAVADAPPAIAIYDTTTGARVASFDASPQLMELRFSANDEALLACGIDGRAVVWRSNNTVIRFGAYRRTLRACNISPDGNRVVLGDSAETSDVWDARDGHRIGPIGEPLWNPAFSHDGSLVSANFDTELMVFAADSGAKLFERNRPLGWYGFTAYDANDATLYSQENGKVVSFDAKTPRRLAFDAPAAEPILATLRDGTRPLTQRADGSLRLWNAETGQALPHAPITATPQVSVADPSPVRGSEDGQRFAAWNGRNAVLVLDTLDGTMIASAPASRLPAVQLDDHGDRLLIANDGPPRVVDVTTGKVVAEIEGFAHATALSNDGRKLLVWNDPSDTQWWDIGSHRAISHLHVGRDLTWFGNDASDQRALLLEEGDWEDGASIGLYDLTTGRRLRSATGIAAHFDETRTRVTISTSARIEVWDVASGDARFLPQLEGEGGVQNAAGTLQLTMTGTAVRVNSGISGRTLFRFDVPDDVGHIAAGANLFYLHSTLRWLPSGELLARHPLHSAVWSFPNDTRSTAAIHADVAAASQYKVIDGKLVARLGRIVGHVTTGAKRVTAMRVQNRLGIPYTVEVGPDGSFAFDQLAFGPYEVTADAKTASVNINSETPVTVELTR